MRVICLLLGLAFRDLSIAQLRAAKPAQKQQTAKSPEAPYGIMQLRRAHDPTWPPVSLSIVPGQPARCKTSPRRAASHWVRAALSANQWPAACWRYHGNLTDQSQAGLLFCRVLGPGEMRFNATTSSQQSTRQQHTKLEGQRSRVLIFHLLQPPLGVSGSRSLFQYPIHCSSPPCKLPSQSTATFPDRCCSLL